MIRTVLQQRLVCFNVTDPVFANYIMLGGIAISLPLVLLGTSEVNQRLQLDSGQTNTGGQLANDSSYGSIDFEVNRSPSSENC